MQLYEQERLLNLLSFDILDSKPEAKFDEITQLVAQLCDTPIALISFIDQNRQWIKARTGLEEVSIAWEAAFCSSTIMEEGLFMLEDASAHELFRHNSLVKNANIKFYAGYPLTTAQGYNVGTLCVLDTRKRTLSKQQQLALQLLATQVVKELELRQAAKQLVAVQYQLKQTESRLLAAEMAASATTDLLLLEGASRKARENHMEFLVALVQEIQPPIDYVVEHIEVVLQEDYVEFGIKNTLRSIQSFLQKPLVLVNNIIDLATLEAGKLELKKSRFLLKDTLKQLHRSLLPKASEKDLSFELDISLGVPDEVVGDCARLSQILFNALDNAISFTDQGNVKLRVEVVYQSDRDWVLEFVVTDTGPGMCLEQQVSKYENFQLGLGNAVRNGPGMGLGLAITKKLVEIQNGSLTITSTPSEGSSLVFHLRYGEPPVRLMAERGQKSSARDKSSF